jgi:hypothetical protein
MGNGSKVPGSYWAVSVLGALWNAFGGYLYTASNMGDKSVTEGAPPEMLAYIADMPTWAHAGWASGIWGSVLGSVLMLMRSRHAATAFLVSLIGALVSYFAQFQAGVLSPAQPIMILAVILLLWWYCRRAAAQGIQK